MKPSPIARNMFSTFFMALILILGAAACNGGSGQEDGQTDMDGADAQDDAAAHDDGAGDVPVEGDVLPDGIDVTVDDPVFDDGLTGCTTEACNAYCESVGMGPGVCEDEACWCQGTSDAVIDPDVPPDIAPDEPEVECTLDTDCFDGNPCTRDICVPATRTCDHSNLSGDFCADTLFCNGYETCIDGACVPGETPCRTEEPICQSADCDESGDACIYDDAPEGTSCDDGLWCNGPDVCQSGFCQRPGPFPCPIASPDPCKMPYCNDSLDVCQEENKPDGMLCNDEFSCNGNEVCIGGVCTPGEPFCEDHDPCTQDICTEGPVPTCQHPWICP